MNIKKYLVRVYDWKTGVSNDTFASSAMKAKSIKNELVNKLGASNVKVAYTPFDDPKYGYVIGYCIEII